MTALPAPPAVSLKACKTHFCSLISINRLADLPRTQASDASSNLGKGARWVMGTCFQTRLWPSNAQDTPPHTSQCFAWKKVLNPEHMTTRSNDVIGMKSLLCTSVWLLVQTSADVQQLHRGMCITGHKSNSLHTETSSECRVHETISISKCCASVRIPASPTLKFRAVPASAVHSKRE